MSYRWPEQRGTEHHADTRATSTFLSAPAQMHCGHVPAMPRACFLATLCFPLPELPDSCLLCVSETSPTFKAGFKDCWACDVFLRLCSARLSQSPRRASSWGNRRGSPFPTPSVPCSRDKSHTLSHHASDLCSLATTRQHNCKDQRPLIRCSRAQRW